MTGVSGSNPQKSDNVTRRHHDPAWIAVPPSTGLPDEVAAQISPVAEKIGFVPNVARLLATAPDTSTAGGASWTI